jgi:hypothetical protein
LKIRIEIVERVPIVNVHVPAIEANVSKKSNKDLQMTPANTDVRIETPVSVNTLDETSLIHGEQWKVIVEYTPGL